MPFLDGAVWLMRLILVAVFSISAIAKLRDRRGTEQAIVDFGLPSGMAPALATLLPFIEAGVAAALISPWAREGALAALGLLTCFSGVMLANLLRGRKPECHCFGQLHSGPAGWPALARNIVLAAGAGAVVFLLPREVGAIMGAWVGELSAVAVVSGIAAALILVLVAFQGLIVLNLVRQNGRLLLRIEALENGSPVAIDHPGSNTEASGLPIDAEAPPFSLSGVHGETLTLDYLRAANRPLLLMFSDPTCGPCNTLLPEIALWQRQYADRLTVALVSRGSLEANQAKSAEHGLVNVLVQSDGEVSAAYLEAGTPSALLVRPDGTIGSPLAAGAEAIRQLVDQVVGGQGAQSLLPMAAAQVPQQANGDSHHASAGPTIGDPAPEVRLPDLKGREVSLASFRGRKTIVVFWDPSCGFCQQMLDALRNWESQRPKSAPRLVVISTGTVAENQRMGLKSPVLIDQNFSSASAFGANGTPMAVLVDEDGNIASGMAAGAPAVLELARHGVSVEEPAPKS